MRLTHLNNIATISCHRRWRYRSIVVSLFLSPSHLHHGVFRYAMVCFGLPWCVRWTRTEAWRLTPSSRSKDLTCHPTRRGCTSSSVDFLFPSLRIIGKERLMFLLLFLSFFLSLVFFFRTHASILTPFFQVDFLGFWCLWSFGCLISSIPIGVLVSCALTLLQWQIGLGFWFNLSMVSLRFFSFFGSNYQFVFCFNLNGF